MFTQKFIKIFHSVQDIGPFSLFQNLALGKASTDGKCHFAIPWARSCQYQCFYKILSKYSKRFKVKFHCFQNLKLGKTSTNPNCHLTISWPTSSTVIWLSHGLHHVNINVYAKLHHNISLSSRDRAIFSFSEFGVRQSLDQLKISFRNLLG